MNKFTFILTLSVIWLIAGCSIDGYENTSAPITDQEIQLTGQIIGESISENQSGILSTFSEAFAVPTSTGLVTGPSLLSSGSFRNIKDYNHNYDSATGEHRVTYTLQRDTPLLSSSADVELTYILYDTEGASIGSPEQNMNRIESVDFSSQQSGTITTGTKNSVYTRTDRILLNGINNQSEILTLDGFHSGEGVFSSTTDTTGTQIQREYLLDMNYLDIRINKDVVLANRNFRNGVNGALSYESTVRETGGAAGNTKIVNGTIEMNGDGTALLNFRDQIEPIRLRLDDGDVFDDDEFEGRITEVDIENQIFTIVNGQRIRIDNQTVIDDGDYQSLNEIAVALNNNQRIVAEGDYFHPDENVNLWVATEVEFEEESNEFQELLQSINFSSNSLTLINGDELFLTDDSVINFDDDFNSLQDVSDTVRDGLPVLADGKFFVDQQSANRFIDEVSFELEFDEFESIVIAADSISGIFELANGRDVLINTETVIEGDYLTLAEVQTALEQGLSIEADGDYYLDQTGDIWIAVQVNFSDGSDDDDDGEDDDSDSDSEED